MFPTLALGKPRPFRGTSTPSLSGEAPFLIPNSRRITEPVVVLEAVATVLSSWSADIEHKRLFQNQLVLTHYWGQALKGDNLA